MFIQIRLDDVIVWLNHTLRFQEIAEMPKRVNNVEIFGRI